MSRIMKGVIQSAYRSCIIERMYCTNEEVDTDHTKNVICYQNLPTRFSFKKCESEAWGGVGDDDGPNMAIGYTKEV